MLKKSIQGSIVSVSSQAGIIALKDHLVYAGSKGALNTMTKVMALELGEYNIRSVSENYLIKLQSIRSVNYSNFII